MKKFVKYGTVAACVLILSGTGIASAAFALGADPVRIWDFVEKRFDVPERYADYRMTIAVEETAIAPATMEITDSDLSEYVYQEVTDLDIRIEDGMVEVYTDQEISNMIVISSSRAEDHQRYMNMQHYKKLEVFASAGEEYWIAIPADWKLQEIEVKISGGLFKGSGICTREAEFLAEGGEIQVTQKDRKKTSLESRGGTIFWTGEGEPSGDMDIESTDGGEITVTLDSGVEIDQIGYDAEYEDAVISFYGDIWEGSGNWYRNTQHGMPHLKMEAERGGSITIQ